MSEAPPTLTDAVRSRETLTVRRGPRHTGTPWANGCKSERIGRQRAMTDPLSHLNAPQREAVLHRDGPLLVLAGAGTGKTAVITHRIAHFVCYRGVSAARVLAVTFINKAAKQMAERAGHLMGLPPSALDMGTFHRLSGRLLRQHAPRLGLDRSFVIYDSDDQLTLIKRCTKEQNIDAQSFAPRALRSRIETWEKCRPHARSGSGAHDGSHRAPGAHAVSVVSTLEANAMDFTDMLLNAAILLRGHDDTRALVQARRSHNLVDEYQDANPGQYAWIKLLVTPQHSLTVVGDDDQSIYRWRGADRQHLAFCERLSGRQGVSAGAKLPVHQHHFGAGQRCDWPQHVGQGQDAVFRVVAGRERPWSCLIPSATRGTTWRARW